MRRVLVLTILVFLCLPLHTPASQAQTISRPTQIAIAGRDGNIYLYDMLSGVLANVTNDAIRSEKIYSWPTWSTDGQLAYFGVEENAYRLGIFIRPVTGDPVQVYESPDEVFAYAYWSPGDCPTGNCRDLAVLYNKSGGGLALRQVRTGGAGSITELAEGAPFYWDWSPDGQSMLWARDGGQLEIYDVAVGRVSETLPETVGSARSVDWSPIDNRLLATVTKSRGASDLVILDSGSRTVLASGLNGVVSSEWSPDGTRVAYADDDGGNLFVVDAATGKVGDPIADGVLAFFWSPDGKKIAYLVLTDAVPPGVAAKPAAQQPDVLLRWTVYDVAEGTSTPLARFWPTRDMIYYLTYFDQFAHSHSLWSPDSRYLVYAEVIPNQGPVISLQDVSQAGTASDADHRGADRRV